jgi:hypothetical protein
MAFAKPQRGYLFIARHAPHFLPFCFSAARQNGEWKPNAVHRAPPKNKRPNRDTRQSISDLNVFRLVTLCNHATYTRQHQKI